MRETPEEIAERIVWGAENAFVAEMTAYLIAQLTSVDFLDPHAQYYVRRMANENPAVLTDIYLKYKDRISDDVRNILEPYVRDIDTERALRDQTGITENTPPYTQGVERLVNSTVNGCVEIVNRQNVALIDNQTDVWYEVSMQAVSETSLATKSMQDIIADAVESLMSAHIQTVDYKSGVHTSIDAAIRRHIVTQVNQNYQRMTELRAKEYDWDLFMCSAHPASRPEHYDFQGEVYSKGQHIGETVDGHKILDYDEMQIGTVTGIYGANCRHYTTVYIPGLSQVQKPPYDAEENEKRYELTQKQRYYERQIRQTKADIYGLQKAGADDTAARLRLGQQQTRIRNFCNENGLTRRYDLERAYGIGDQPRALAGKHVRNTVQPPVSFASGQAANSYFEDDSNLLKKRDWYSESFKAWTTNEGFRAINSYARTGKRGVVEILGSDIPVEKVSGYIDGFIGTRELKDDIVVYRVMSRESFEKRFKDGKYTDKGYTATSAVFSSIEGGFMDGTPETSVWLEITVPKGKGRGAYINEASEYKDAEFEYIIKRDSVFDVSGSRTEVGKASTKYGVDDPIERTIYTARLRV